MIWIIGSIWYIVGFIYSLKTDYRIIKKLGPEAIVAAAVFGLIGPVITVLYYIYRKE